MDPHKHTASQTPAKRARVCVCGCLEQNTYNDGLVVDVALQQFCGCVLGIAIVDDLIKL